MSDVMYEKITVANVSELKSDDEIYSFNTGTNAYEKVKYESASGSKYGEILEEKAKIDRVKADELVKAKAQDSMNQSQYDNNGPIGAPQAVAFVLAEQVNDKYQYKLAFFKLYKKQIDTNTATQRSNLENGSSGVETRDSWGYVALFSTMRIFGEDNDSSIKNRFSNSVFVAYDKITFDASDLFTRANQNFNRIGMPIGLISFDMDHDISYADLINTYQTTNLNDGKWVIPVKLSNPKCIYVNKNNCGLISEYTVAPKQDNTGKLKVLQDKLNMSNRCRNQFDSITKQANANNKSTWFSIKTKRLAKIEAEIKQALTNTDCANKADVTVNDNTVTITSKYKSTYESPTELEKQIRSLNQQSQEQKLAQIQLVNFDVNQPNKQFTSHPNAVFFINPDPQGMDLGNLVLLVANQCKSNSGGKRTLRKRRSHHVKKTKNKKHKKHGTRRRGQRHKYSMRRKRIH